MRERSFTHNHSIPFHRFISGSEAHIQSRQTLDNKTENQHREDDKNTENMKHTVKQPRQKNERTCTFTQLEATLHNVMQWQNITQ